MPASLEHRGGGEPLSLTARELASLLYPFSSRWWARRSILLASRHPPAQGGRERNRGFTLRPQHSQRASLVRGWRWKVDVCAFAFVYLSCILFLLSRLSPFPPHFPASAATRPLPLTLTPPPEDGRGPSSRMRLEPLVLPISHLRYCVWR